MKSLAIIIVNWNTKDLLERCLDSIVFSCPGEPLSEIIVVDNGSSDGSNEMVRAQHPQVTLIENQSNLGFAAANNQAAKVATSDALLLLNSDTVVHNGSITEMFRMLDKHSDVGVVGCQLFFGNGSKQGSFADFPSLKSALAGKDRRNHKKYFDDTPAYKVDAVSGACLMVKKDVWQALDGMDESYEWFVEEVDFCYRANIHGWTTCWLPNVGVTHFLGQSRKNRSWFSYLHLHRSRLIFFRKHYGLRKTRLLRYGYGFIAFFKMTAYLILSIISPRGRWDTKKYHNILLLKWIVAEQDVIA